MLLGVVGAVCIAVAALGRKVKKEREMATWQDWHLDSKLKGSLPAVLPLR